MTQIADAIGLQQKVVITTVDNDRGEQVPPARRIGYAYPGNRCDCTHGAEEVDDGEFGEAVVASLDERIPGCVHRRGQQY